MKAEKISVPQATRKGTARRRARALRATTLARNLTPTLSDTRSVAAVGGVAVFSNLRISRDHKDFRLRAVASGLTSATSNKFDVRKADDDDDDDDDEDDLSASGVASRTTGRFAPVR
jgi:hypothetical protein